MGDTLAKILTVDDDADISESLRCLLEELGHEVRTACDGNDGLRLLRQELADLVILDVEMPQLTGPEMAHRMIIEDSGKEDIPVLLSSGIVGLDDVAARVGTPYFLAKPVDVDELLALVERALREKIPPSPDLEGPRS